MQFNHPFGVCVTRDDRVIVADFRNNRLQELPDLGRAGTATLLGVGLLQIPFAVALTPAEDALVVRQEGGTNRVVVLARDGSAILRVLLTKDDVAYAHTGHYGLAVSRSGVMAAADCGQQKIMLRSVGGEWKRTVDAALLGGPLGSVRGAAWDSQERLWSCHRKDKCFVVISSI